MSRSSGQATLVTANTSKNLSHATGQNSEGTSWNQISRFWLAGMARKVRIFAPHYWKIEQAKRAANNLHWVCHSGRKPETALVVSVVVCA
jgi:hypothetical protein